MKYDNSIILRSICDIFKNNVYLNVIGNSCESFKIIDFKFKKIKYSLKLLKYRHFKNRTPITSKRLTFSLLYVSTCCAARTCYI